MDPSHAFNEAQTPVQLTAEEPQLYDAIARGETAPKTEMNALNSTFIEYLYDLLPESAKLENEEDEEPPQSPTIEYMRSQLYNTYDDDGMHRADLIEDALSALPSGLEKLRRTQNSFNDPVKAAFIKSNGLCKETIWESAFDFFDKILEKFDEVLTPDAPIELFQPLFTFIQLIWEKSPSDDCIDTQSIIEYLIIRTVNIVRWNFRDLEDIMDGLVPESIQDFMANLKETCNAGARNGDKKARAVEYMALRERKLELVATMNHSSSESELNKLDAAKIRDHKRQRENDEMTREIRNRKDMARMPPPLSRPMTPSQVPN